MAGIRDWLASMWSRPDKAKEVLLQDLIDIKTSRRPFPVETLIEELPLWSLFYARLMLRDPVVQIGLDARNAALASAQVMIQASDPLVEEYAQRIWHEVWAMNSMILLRVKCWGFMGLRVRYDLDEQGRLVPYEFIDYEPYTTKCMTLNGLPVGFRLRHRGTASPETLWCPKALWLTYNRSTGNPYGDSLLRNSYSPWYEKWMPNGAKKVMQLRMLKDAYIGDIAFYPHNMHEILPSGERISWRDIIRESVENRLTGATKLLPAIYDANGRELVKYQPPMDTGDPQGIFNWLNDMDINIWRGMKVYEELIKAGATGSGFSGRSVPLMLFINSCQEEFIWLVQDVTRGLIEPLIMLEYGPQAWVRMIPQNMLTSFSESVRGSVMGGQPMGGVDQTSPVVPPEREQLNSGQAEAA